MKFRILKTEVVINDIVFEVLFIGIAINSLKEVLKQIKDLCANNFFEVQIYIQT